MAIPFFTIVIERDGETYRAYTPNLSGIVATGSREFVEQSVLDQAAQYLDQLWGRHAESARRLELSKAPIEERITCLFKYTNAWRSSCNATAAKEGLCRQHWRMLYGHAVDSSGHFKACYLCDETDVSELSTWSVPCSFKATYENWATVLDQKRQAANAERRARKTDEERRRVIASMPHRCVAKLSGQPEDGEQCSKQALKDRCCAMHWRVAYGHEIRNGRCRNCNETDADILAEWRSPCPSKVKSRQEEDHE